jgi:hypothetical protein
MAAPVVSGTAALMFQANPSLTPNQVKAILQYTSQIYSSYDLLTQGAGFLNAQGAVALARYFAAPTEMYPSDTDWGRQLIWANRQLRGGRLTSDANAWPTGVVWGAPLTPNGQNVVWGVIESSGGWTTWGTACADPSCSTFVWGGSGARNVVWGAKCGGADCVGSWNVEAVTEPEDTVVWGTADGDTVVWGTTDGADTVVWGTDEDTVVWGTASVEPVLWDNSDAPEGVN